MKVIKHARMSYLDIKDPKKRDQIVNDYVNSLKVLRERKEDEKTRGLARQFEIEKVFKPVVQATEKSTEAITSEIKKSKQSDIPVTTLKKSGKPWNSSMPYSAIEYYLSIFPSKYLDKYFGVQVIDDHYMIGDKTVDIDNKSNIIIDEHEFEGTPGLWELIMLSTPFEYTDEDFTNYKDLVHLTDLTNNPLGVKPGSRPGTTKKMSNELQRVLDEAETDSKTGHGIQFIPGDINGMLNRLRLLIAENQAGNTISTRNEIVTILDELLNRKYFTQEEYNAICKSLSC